MDKLTKILASLSHLDLQGAVVEKQPYASGLGGSCDVYSAWSVKHNKKVAVKQIRAFLRKDLSLASKLAKEIRIWAKLEHENVLPLLGYFTEGEGVMPALVSEWMEKGTLHDLMTTFPRAEGQTWAMLLGVVSGLAYLHSKGIIHADLKSQNILVSPNDIPLLADFGLSLALSQSQSTMGATTTSSKGTIRWMARELLHSETGDEPSKHNKATDIWAFGMVVYELLSWSVPYKNKTNDVLVIMAIVSGQLPEKPEAGNDAQIFNTLWYLCTLCWKTLSTSRPAASYIADFLSKGVPRESQLPKTTFLPYLSKEGRRRLAAQFLQSQQSTSRLEPPDAIFAPDRIRHGTIISSPRPTPVSNSQLRSPPSPDHAPVAAQFLQRRQSTSRLEPSDTTFAPDRIRRGTITSSHPPTPFDNSQLSSLSVDARTQQQALLQRALLTRPDLQRRDASSPLSATSTTLGYGQQSTNNFYDDRNSNLPEPSRQPSSNVGHRRPYDGDYDSSIPHIEVMSRSQLGYNHDIDGHRAGRGSSHGMNYRPFYSASDDVDDLNHLIDSGAFDLSSMQDYEAETSQQQTQPLSIPYYGLAQPDLFSSYSRMPEL